MQLVSGGITKKKTWSVVYPNIPSALHPVPHGKGISIPELLKEFAINSDDEDEGKSTSGSREQPASIEPQVSHCWSSAPQPHILTQDELNNFFCNSELSKTKAELLGSSLNPLPVQFKSLLPGQEGCVFFSGHLNTRTCHYVLLR
jgi:hypothetical protein